MSAQGYIQLRIEVRPSPETNDHEVCLLGDGESLVDRFSSGLIGLDPEDLFTDPCPLRAENNPRRVTVGRCSCGIVGCGSVEVDIRRDHDEVIWTALDSSKQVHFLAVQYDGEVERALHDHTWETPDRTASRLISQAVNRTLLVRRGFEFSWASGRCREGMMTVSLFLAPGPYQVLINVPWDGKDIEGIITTFKAILAEPPETWLNVECNPQVRGLGPPPIMGPGWNTRKW